MQGFGQGAGELWGILTQAAVRRRRVSLWGLLDVVVQTCNPSTRDEGSRRIESLRLAWATHPKTLDSKRKKKKLGVVVNSCNFNTQKVEAGEL